MNVGKLLGRNSSLFNSDIIALSNDLSDFVCNNRFLIIGGAGSIGNAVTLEISKRNPKTLHIVDINENNTVELVRNIRSTLGYCDD